MSLKTADYRSILSFLDQAGRATNVDAFRTEALTGAAGFRGSNRRESPPSSGSARGEPSTRDPV